MVQRIRYIKKENLLITRDSIVSNKGSNYIVVIDLTTMTYFIKNQLSLRKYEGGEGINNLHVLKRNIKKHLQKLGCVFEKEKRARTFGVCEKGMTEAKNKK